jgi:ribonuclease P protein component
VIKLGKRRVSEHFVVVMTRQDVRDNRKPTEAPSHFQPPPSRFRPRLGVTVSKRVGNSVIRNRVKRLIREWFRRARAGLPDQAEIVVIARDTARGLSGSEAAEQLDRMIHSLRVGSGYPAAAGTR